MKSNDIRQAFLDFFSQHGHEKVASSALVPGNDPTLLFTNAGMVQFKNVFLGEEKRQYTRAVSAQRCVRAGGKHNDLENVGYTARHHTFFEMLGNFSFGDYFKEEAIQLAWRFLTEVLKLPEEKLWVSVFREDDEAKAIWEKTIGLDPSRISRCGEEDNFWSMGETGPCGPCSEIFYDHGPEIPGGPPGSPEQDGDRYIEIWNLVFMQYNRASDGSMTPLPKPSVDTGMGLERIAAVLQGVHNNYEIDLFQHIIKATATLAGTKDLTHTSLKVIADHIRSTAFLITDGVIPSNEGRGYVLRRIIRRALRHGHQLGLRDPFFSRLVQPLVDEMGEAYPELAQNKGRVEEVILREEKQFALTLDQGMMMFEQSLKALSGTQIPGEVVFKLYDTFGFPPDLTADMAREHKLTIDFIGFEEAMKAQRARSHEHSQFSMDYNQKLAVSGETVFTGYSKLSDRATTLQLFVDGEETSELTVGQSGLVVLDQTPFYAESGGQVGDTGLIVSESATFQVEDTQKQGEVYLHYGRVEQGALTKGVSVDAQVSSNRLAIMLNHSATHLLHAALRRVLGSHVLQKGSLVEAERLRFDFAHYEPMTSVQLREVERLVNQQIRANLHSDVTVMSPEQAKQEGALALFGEKYGDEVRVLRMGAFSMELCGGTHVEYSGEIGVFKIISETGIASGVRRVEALTGEAAFDWIALSEQQLQEAAGLLKADRETLITKLQHQIKEQRALEKQLERLQQKVASTKSSELLNQAISVGGLQVIAAEMDAADTKTLRNTVDKLKSQLNAAVVLLASVKENKIQIVAGVSKSETSKIKAGDLVNHVATQVGGKGGGRPDMAQGGGDQPDQLTNALASIPDWVQNQLNKQMV